MPLSPPNYANALCVFAERLYGENWQGPLARTLGVPKLRIARIAARARLDRDYPGAAQLLAELRACLAPIVDDMGPWVRGVSITGKDRTQ